MKLAKFIPPSLKLLFGLSLFAYFISAGKIDYEVTLSLLSSPLILAIMWGGNFLITIFASLRWSYFIRKDLKQKIPFVRVLSYQWISLFFGLAFFGMVGTDIARLKFLWGQQEDNHKNIPMVILKDRGVSFIALIILTGFLVAFSPSLFSTLFVVTCCCVLGLIFYRPFVYALLGHSLKIILIVFLMRAVVAAELVGELSLALLLESLPISWQGLGVGHWAMDMATVKNGANLYSAYFLGKLTFKFLGLFVWIFLRNRNSQSGTNSKKFSAKWAA